MRQKKSTIRSIAAFIGLASGIAYAADEFVVAANREEIPLDLQSGWPQGVLDILNDKTRTTKMVEKYRWVSAANDVSFYGMAIRNMDDVNRLVRYLSAIKSGSPELYLQPEKRWSEGHGEGAFFSFGNQKVLDEWYKNLPEVEPGVRGYAAQRYEKPPTAEVRLGLYVDHPAVDLTKLDVPPNVNITTATALAYREEHASEFKQIDAFIERHKAKQQTTATHSQWLADTFAKTQSIKPGMTRADLEKLFDHDSGSLRDQSEYSLRECPCIKIVANFQLPGAPADNEDWSHDKITTISKPFLEAPKRE
jgi:hypothetical protein